MKTKIIVHFTLTGTFDPAEVTNSLGIEPTDTWRFGDSIQNTSASYKHDGWMLSTNEMETLNLSEQVEIILSQLFPLAAKVRGICKRFKLEAEVACVIQIEDKQAPIIHFDREIITKINELNAEIDIDLYP